MDVVELDPHRAGIEELAEYYRVRQDGRDPEDDDRPDFEAAVERMRNPFPGLGEASFRLVRDAGTAVAVAYLRFPEDQNAHIVVVDVIVHPDHRRRGVGTKVLRHLAAEFAARGRRVVEGWLVPEDGPGDLWGRGLGFRTVRAIARLRLDLATADRALWDVPPPAGYRVARWPVAVPEEYLESYAVARGAIHDAPIGQTEFRPPEWTAERVREYEAQAREQGNDQRVVVALHGDTVVGLSEVLIVPHHPQECYQGDTAVLTAHRGHRIGLWLKGEMARWLTEDRPEVRRLSTATEGDNDHMIRVNHEMGFRSLTSSLVIACPVADLR
ncbi:GNAT family N-acetyltransferase [Actinosynnema sp. NPDC047251]|uniref:N-acetyltransferase domain-containing protein n=1 Tax=Saccharothrix espanaensis (strain ATCC 51144 / DSM 44229 / JCM 9112 / NBRC 15066 / NRRL 15764) TaxID=1179773 RepID=K0JPA7_SACES|nr:GNAT family N-acetyltransferase [Saccharothrix espanaensis]CCH28440.1 hypothetical protein BN6_11140 [Saccharothrix espanaensis DSM 44229]